MLAQTHGIVSSNVCRKLSIKYDIELNKKSFVWGSIIPDINPKYRTKSHYPDVSLDYIVKEINNLIFIGRFIDFPNKDFYGILNRLFSRKLGIISHFLADFVTRPHYEAWTFYDDIVRHVKYENTLGRLSNDFTFKEIPFNRIDYIEDDQGNINIENLIKDFISDVLEEYNSEINMERDLDFAYNLNLKVSDFVLETIILYNQEKALKKIIVF